MIPAWDYEQVSRQLDNGFRHRYPDGEIGSVRMVGLLFAPPEAKLSKDEIVASLDYFHHRSGKHIDFFCAGYSRYGLTPGQRQVTNDEPPWMFSLDVYHRFQREIERLSSWRYSGEADLLLMNGKRDRDGAAATLDFNSAVVCDLDRMIRDGAIFSVRRFFEDVFHFAEQAETTDPTWGFSDKMGHRVGGSAIKRMVLSLLPNHMCDDYTRAEHFAVRDVGVTS